MGKKFVAVVIRNRIHKIYNKDIVKIHLAKIRSIPPLPTFQLKNETIDSTVDDSLLISKNFDRKTEVGEEAN